MEKEFNFDQEVVTVNIADKMLSDEKYDVETEGLSAEDYTIADESEIDWSTL